jgi:hypothetical protein
MQIVQFNQPGLPYHFALHFGKRTIRSFLNRIASWKQFLAGDFLLTPDQKAQATVWIKMVETYIWAVVRDANIEIGDWKLRWLAHPPETGPDGKAMTSAITVKAMNRGTKEIRLHEIPGKPVTAPIDFAAQMEEMYTALGLRDQLSLESPYEDFMNKRSAKGWPVYTRIIPPLYDYLLPHYQSPGHYSNGTDNDAGPTPLAMYPKELLEDMLIILKTHHGYFLGDFTTADLKGHIQRHLERNADRRSDSANER